MTHLLVISPDPKLSSDAEALLPAGEFQCHHKESVERSLALIERGGMQGCLLDADLDNGSKIKQIQAIRAIHASIPIFVVSGKTAREWEEKAILHGADFVLSKPLRGALLNKLLARHRLADPAPSSPNKPPLATSNPPPRIEHHDGDSGDSLSGLESLRDFSRIFSHSLNLETFIHQFVLKFRDVIGVNRIAIFLDKSLSLPSGPFAIDEPSRFDCPCSIGIAQEAIEYLTMTSRSGILHAVLKSGRILRYSPSVTEILSLPESDIQREFELLGGRIAVPIIDRGRVIGLITLGDRITGQPFCNKEIQLIFHLMEELGISIKNILLYNSLVSTNNLITSVFSRMSSGFLVVDSNLNIIHVNPAFTSLLNLPAPFQFSHLPKRLAAMLHESACLGKTHDPFIHHDEPQGDKSHRVSVAPFHHEKTASKGAMMLIEDFTQVEAAPQTDIDSSILRVISTLAEKFVHEIRNALVPLDTYRQLLPESKDDPVFLKTMGEAMEQQVQRISRLADQLIYLSKQDFPMRQTESIGSLLQQAFTKAKTMIPTGPKLEVDNAIARRKIRCDSSSIKHAFFEILLNGFQAAPDHPIVTATGSVIRTEGNPALLILEFRDEGPGITSDLSRKAIEPFFTTRSVGMGLGLSVARNIIEKHKGKLEIQPDDTKKGGTVVVSLPVCFEATTR